MGDDHIAIGFGEIGLQRDRAFQRIDRLAVTVVLQIRIAEIVERVRIARPHQRRAQNEFGAARWLVAFA